MYGKTDIWRIHLIEHTCKILCTISSDDSYCFVVFLGIYEAMCDVRI